MGVVFFMNIYYSYNNKCGGDFFMNKKRKYSEYADNKMPSHRFLIV